MSRALWQSVLLRTVEDALIGVAQATSRDRRILECKHARAYLTKPSKDLSEVCALAGMDMQAVMERMRKQIAQAPTPEELADKPNVSRQSFTKAPAKPKKVPFRDREFTIGDTTRTATEWCERTGISINTASRRIGKGWGAEPAFTMTDAEARAVRSEAARAAYQAVTNIANPQQADRQKHRKPGTPPMLYECGGEILTLDQWADRTGINKTTLYARITRQGMTFAEAISTPPMSRGRWRHTFK
ncbi:hypothetical protein MU516_07045 [Paracoccus sp. YLB-12]|uniref:Uncharacterized protein n=1 Tax=Paracoccus maritimus TaxID=2933292 RepID=A0ABT2K7U9_9RHOB|nr:hypothetical protein [Paracoccus sp. YLB-12]MCT4332622.1 hypothetical protein [Paracoccus sp. YLB-12]